MRDGAQKYEEMGPQVESLKNETAEVREQLGQISSERLPAITEHLTTVTKQLETLKNNCEKMESDIEGFVRSELKKNDWEIPWDHKFLNGEGNKSSEGIPNMENLMTDSEYPPEFFGLVGISRQEILPEFQKIRDSFEELKRESDRRYEELKRDYEELKRDYEELKRENKSLKSRITPIGTLKNK